MTTLILYWLSHAATAAAGFLTAMMFAANRRSPARNERDGQ